MRNEDTKICLYEDDDDGETSEIKDYQLIAEDDAGPIIESHFCLDEKEQVYVCKVCRRREVGRSETFNHCLEEHLQIFLFQCDICGAQFKFQTEIQKHYLTRHQKKFEKNSKLDKLSKAEYYESLETDFPDPLLDISTLPLEELN